MNVVNTYFVQKSVALYFLPKLFEVRRFTESISRLRIFGPFCKTWATFLTQNILAWATTNT